MKINSIHEIAEHKLDVKQLNHYTKRNTSYNVIGSKETKWEWNHFTTYDERTKSRAVRRDQKVKVSIMIKGKENIYACMLQVMPRELEKDGEAGGAKCF